MKFSLPENRLLCLDFISIVCSFGDLCALTEELFFPDSSVVRHRVDSSKSCSVSHLQLGFWCDWTRVGFVSAVSLPERLCWSRGQGRFFPVIVNNGNRCATESSLHLFPLSEALHDPYFFLHSCRGTGTHSIRLWLQLFGCSLVVKMDSVLLFSK